MTTMAVANPLADLEQLDWRVVNDGVMGGVSTGQVTVEDGAVTFVGELSLDNNGGFASIRTAPRSLQLGQATALQVTVLGDGRTWDLTLRRGDVPIRAGSYRVAVTTDTEPVTVEVPLAAFRPTSFGRPVAGAPALDAAAERVDSIGFLLADKQPGPFRLAVLAVVPVGEAEARGPGHDQVRAALAEALSVGVPAFNRGDAGGCRDAYEAALKGIVDQVALTAGEREIVRGALARGRTQAAREAAWTYRYAIDTVLAGAERR